MVRRTECLPKGWSIKLKNGLKLGRMGFLKYSASYRENRCSKHRRDFGNTSFRRPTTGSRSGYILLEMFYTGLEALTQSVASNNTGGCFMDKPSTEFPSFWTQYKRTTILGILGTKVEESMWGLLLYLIWRSFMDIGRALMDSEKHETMFQFKDNIITFKSRRGHLLPIGVGDIFVVNVEQEFDKVVEHVVVASPKRKNDISIWVKQYPRSIKSRK
ncbi:hypothetical protein HAX54_004649 [Datura stramonium]|uniref:Uncharacterized protein n=1 Tax=Datura stramonium TaxID=4076 RepID=A0ABS8T8N5_DATST|nr:hypothetical protein [Datura stramonium]